MSAQTDQFDQRNLFKQARENIQLGRISAFKQNKKALQYYLLYPYLEYYDLNRRISSVSAREINAFREENPTLPVSDIVYRRWLIKLGQNGKWDQLETFYEPSTDARLQCYYLRAVYRSGERNKALSQTAPLWTQPTSQPEACDPLFDVWRNSRFFTEDVAWQRITAAVSANEITLARYLLRYLSGHNRVAGDALVALHRSPSRITNYARYILDSKRMRYALAHGLNRLATRDPEKALNAWQRYRKSHTFDNTTAALLSQKIAAEIALEIGNFPPLDEIHQAEFQLALAKAAIHNQNWAELEQWISALPSIERDKNQWRYWHSQARLMQDKKPSEDFRALAQERHYYGFLAARLIGLPGQLNAANERYDPLQANRVRQNPHLRRALELFAVGDDLNGRREWFAGLRGLSPNEQAIAAALAQEAGMVNLAIRSANTADATDHLHLRFPLAHEPAFRFASLSSGLPPATLFAISRQESALQANARSTADARGLMQLLPSTAKLVARRAKRPVPTADDLYDPNTNITLGSYHLAWLGRRYQGQFPLVAAAYNAGEHRVDRWIKNRQDMPMDVWIETIPFRETRNYVKNVLAFRHVYAQRLNAPIPILTAQELTVREQK
ncbi:MAG: transglycosylase SLT domain-containing protein [Pseudomonadota bacterium]